MISNPEYEAVITLWLLSSAFRRFMINNLRLDSIVYRLIDASLIGNFSMIPLHLKLKVLVIYVEYNLRCEPKG